MHIKLVNTDVSAEDILTKPCIWCAKQIEDGAVVCDICGRSQNRFWEYVKYCAGLVGLMSLIAGALTYTVGRASAFLDERSQPEVEVLYFRIPGDIVLRNSGRSSVYISNIEWKAEDLMASGVDVINKRLASGDMFTYKVADRKLDQGLLIGEINNLYYPAIRLSQSEMEIIKKGKYSGYSPITMGMTVYDSIPIASKPEPIKASCKVSFSNRVASKEKGFDCVSLVGLRGKDKKDAIEKFFAAMQ